MNRTTQDHLYDIIENFYVRDYAVIGIYVPIFSVALIANILLIWVIIREQYIRNVTNYFLVNLAVADLMVTLVCMPNAAYAAYSSIYYFGEYTCKITAYLQCISVASSIFTITTMAIDRYLAINKPFGIFYRCFNKKTTIIVILLIWLFSSILFSPILFIAGTQLVEVGPFIFQNVTFWENDIYTCAEKWEDLHNLTSNFHMTQESLGITWFISMFVIPGFVMMFAYSMMSKTLCSVAPPFDDTDAISSTQQRNRLIRSRKRVACILLLLAFVFAGCWLPYHIVSLKDDLTENEKSSKNLLKNLLLLGHANSALNPIIYCALSRKFRSSIKDLLASGMTYLRSSSRNRNQWMDSSATGTQLHYSQRLKTVPNVHNQFHFTLSRLQSSQKTTKTCAV